MMEIRLGLDRIEGIMDELNNPQEKLKIIHIAGTNGKGSVGAYLENILISSGMKVGRYVSPAVFEPMEIIKVSGKSIEYTKYTEEIENLKKISSEATLFELETALAYKYFYEEKCDIAIIEVGLGGLQDATNVIKNPVCEVITSISMDHMSFLGNTIEEIAMQKCGIIKKNSNVVTFNQENNVLNVIEDVAKEKNANLIIANKEEVRNIRISENETIFEYKGEKYTNLLLGEHQIENAIIAIEVAKKLDIDYESIYLGIKNTKWRGRLEKISNKPLVLLDGAHNEKAAISLKNTIELYFDKREWIYVVGVLADKEYDKMLHIMSKNTDKIIVFKPDNERGLESEKLAECAKKYFTKVVDAKNIENALKMVYAMQERIEITNSENRINNNESLIYNKKYIITNDEEKKSTINHLIKKGFINECCVDNKEDTKRMAILIFGSLSFMKDIY